jgi:hypothetical protein
MSLNMLIEFGDAFDFSGADFRRWCGESVFAVSRSFRSPAPRAPQSRTNNFRMTPQKSSFNILMKKKPWKQLH